MGKAWVLDTETKGTGAQMVPLEKLETKSVPRARRASPRPMRKQPQAPAPRQPRRFKVVDIVSRRVLAEGTGTRATLDVLEGVRSAVDVSVFVWDEQAERWRQLSHRERKALWGFRGGDAGG